MGSFSEQNWGVLRERGQLGIADSIKGRLGVLGGVLAVLGGLLLIVWALALRTLGVGPALVLFTGIGFIGIGLPFAVANRGRGDTPSVPPRPAVADDAGRLSFGKGYASKLGSVFWVRVPLTYHGPPAMLRGWGEHLTPPHDTRSPWDACWKEFDGREIPVLDGERRFINLLKIEPTDPDNPTLTLHQVRPDLRATTSVRFPTNSDHHEVRLTVADTLTGMKQSRVLTLGFEPGALAVAVRVADPVDPQSQASIDDSQPPPP